ncbi:MAG: AAA family ATPase [Syntrophaceae bacterium]|nr:AAA family ATPase [Syntrophaceae bacterium]
MILSKKIVEKINQTYSELERKGEIFSDDQFKHYIEIFKSNFGPDILASLDGETLLNKIHDISNKDSLVYWLEFKNDEEFSTIRFGSIAGGSSLKYGIYKRKDTGIWMTGSSQKQQKLTINEAIAKARLHRDQLIAGCEIFNRFPEKGSPEDYGALQKELEEKSPDIVNTVWAHKYFFLLFPTKLDDYHAEDYQRFYLIKLMQKPHDIKGRFACAGAYVAIADDLSMLIPNLTTVLNEICSRPHKYWRIGTKLEGKYSIWELMQREKCVAIGWGELNDLSDIAFNKEGKEKLKSIIQKQFGYSPQLTGKNTQQVFNFVAAIQAGDYVVPCDGRHIKGVGKVTGEYYYEKGVRASHRRPVEWLAFHNWEMPTHEGLQTTIHGIKNEDNLLSIEKQLMESSELVFPPKRRTNKLTGIPSRIQSVLERKKQVILYGPPGTGKTYWAIQAALELASLKRFNKSFADLNSKEKERIQSVDKDTPGLVRMCSFHPAYGYEDFIEGYRPYQCEGKLYFQLKDGVFKKLCRDAEANANDSFYLIVDEVNRGDIPRIFGELMTLIEKDKRGTRAILPASGEKFSIPDNVYIIGTMNTADRSIALLDTALRRRFGFIELMPDAGLLKETFIEGLQLGAWLNALNQTLCREVGRDARNLQIGHAYFLEDGHPVKSVTKLTQIIRDDILPLIQEYCYEDYQALEKILGKAFVDATTQQVKTEIFNENKQDEFIQALKSIDPTLGSTIDSVEQQDQIPEDDDFEDADDNQSSESK